MNENSNILLSNRPIMFLCRQNPPTFAFKIEIAPRSLKSPHVSISQRLSNSLLCHFPWLYPFPPSLTSLRSCLYFSLFASACFWVCWAKKGGVEPQAIPIPRVRVSPILRNSNPFFLSPNFVIVGSPSSIASPSSSPVSRRPIDPVFAKYGRDFPQGLQFLYFQIESVSDPTSLSLLFKLQAFSRVSVIFFGK